MPFPDCSKSFPEVNLKKKIILKIITTVGGLHYKEQVEHETSS